MIWVGNQWQAITIDELADPEKHCREFEAAEILVHDEHEDLKELWEEYMITRRLKLGR